MTEDLVRELRGNGPVSPAVQFRVLLAFGRSRGWTFEAAWRWSFERVKWPHDTGHRLEWKSIFGTCYDDPRPVPLLHREAWGSAYERREQTRREGSVGRLTLAA